MYPIPSIEPGIERALEAATHWDQHPHFAVESMTEIAKAYADAKMHGAAAARARLLKDLAGCPRPK
jgi:hypothetical protein